MARISKTELRRLQIATQRRFIIVFILVAFTLGLMIGWITPSAVVIRLMCFAMLVMAAVVLWPSLKERVKQWMRRPKKSARRLPARGRMRNG